MASDYTAHYHLDKYVATDKPNLRDQYNAAMDKTDDALYTANVNATDAKAAALAAQQAVAGKASQADLDALSALLPANQFSSQDTVKAALTALGNRITPLEQQDYMLVIGDSFSSDSQSGTPLWYTYVAKHYGLQAYTTASDGMGFVVGANSFLVQAQNAANSLPVARVKRVFVLGGLNDTRNSSFDIETFQQAVGTLLSFLQSTFTNAIIEVYGPEAFPNINYNNVKASTWMSWQCVTRGIEYHDLTAAFHLYNDFFGGKTGTNEHPSALGEKIIAAHVIAHGNTSTAIWVTTNLFTSATPTHVLNSSNETIPNVVVGEWCSRSGSELVYTAELDYSNIPNSTQVKIVIAYNLAYVFNCQLGISSAPTTKAASIFASQLTANSVISGWVDMDQKSLNFNASGFNFGSGAKHVRVYARALLR